MKITTKNKHLINDELYIHDSRFQGYTYCDKSRSLIIDCDNLYLGKRFHIQFNRVLYHELMSFSYAENASEIVFWNTVPNLWAFERIDSMKELPSDFSPDRDLYISSVITIASWKTLLVICEDIEFEESCL